jgi:hypothetical protein
MFSFFWKTFSIHAFLFSTIIGETYNIVVPAASPKPGPKPGPAESSEWLKDKRLKSQIQNATVLCKASYNEDISEVIHFLQDTTENHNIEFVSQSQVYVIFIKTFKEP